MKSRIFFTGAYQDIELAVQALLNSHEEFLSPSTARSPRAVGDAIESILAASFDTLLGDLCDEYSASFARRAMADLAFKDVDGLYYVVDVKTHRTDTKCWSSIRRRLPRLATGSRTSSRSRSPGVQNPTISKAPHSL